MANAEAVVTEVIAEDQEASLVLDAYGRDAAERTVELNSHVAEAANAIVEDSSIDTVLQQLKAEFEGGQPKTYDDAIGYIVYRGIAEIKRQRDAAAATKEKSKLAETKKLYKSMLAVNPALATDPTFVAKMIDALGMR
jgi:hypothetical protein